MHFGFPASVLIIRMDNDLGKLTKSSHAYAESTVKPPFGGNDSDQLLSDDLFNSSFYPLCYISAAPGKEAKTAATAYALSISVSMFQYIQMIIELDAIK